MTTRIIKFRAWHPPVVENGEVVLDGFMNYELTHHKLLAVRTETREIPTAFGFEHVTQGLYHINQDLADYGERLMQFTGLFDKNEKEIYEGDVVKGYDERNWVVEWNQDPAGFYIYAPENKTNRHSLRTVKGKMELEIIGNVWETPDY